jgi:hypothetical protein
MTWQKHGTFKLSINFRYIQVSAWEEFNIPALDDVSAFTV